MCGICMSAESGEQAISKLIQAHSLGDPFGLLLTDMHMPHMDGFMLVEKLRQNIDMGMPAIMMLTSAGYSGDVERCHQLGISSYLFKPIRRAELLSAIAATLQQPRMPTEAYRRTLLPLANGDGIRILLVEDNRINQRLAVRILEKAGHIVKVANHGIEALSALESEIFDLVFMDIQMPHMDGITATREIRRREKKTQLHVPIIAMTAHAMKGDREKCMECGMDGYVTKPIVHSQIDEAIQLAREQRKQEHPL